MRQMFHDEPNGAPLIDALARFGDGLPAQVLPFAVNEITRVGLESIAAAFAYGASAVRFLSRAWPRHDGIGLARTIALVEPTLIGLGFGAGRVATIETDDPDRLGSTLRAIPSHDRAGGGEAGRQALDVLRTHPSASTSSGCATTAGLPLFRRKIWILTAAAHTGAYHRRLSARAGDANEAAEGGRLNDQWLRVVAASESRRSRGPAPGEGALLSFRAASGCSAQCSGSRSGGWFGRQPSITG
jgi:hypothetical protein